MLKDLDVDCSKNTPVDQAVLEVRIDVSEEVANGLWCAFRFFYEVKVGL